MNSKSRNVLAATVSIVLVGVVILNSGAFATAKSKDGQAQTSNREIVNPKFGVKAAKFDDEKAALLASLAGGRASSSKAMSKTEARRSVSSSDADGPSIETGIEDDNEAPASGNEFVSINRWGGSFDGLSYTIYAGFGGVLNPTTGTVLILKNLDNSSGEVLPTYVSVSDSGALKIMSVDSSNGVVHLVGDNGDTFQVDLRTASFAP